MDYTINKLKDHMSNLQKRQFEYISPDGFITNQYEWQNLMEQIQEFHTALEVLEKLETRKTEK